MHSLPYYYVLKTTARERVQAALNRRIMREPGSIVRFDGLTLSSIVSPDMPDALNFADKIWPEHYVEGGWQGFGKRWHEIVVPRLIEPDMFDLALWQRIEDKQVLAALAFGTASHARTHLTVKWVERFMGHTHVSGSVLLVVLACAEEYAKLLGCKRVLIKDPLVPHLYENYGYRQYRHPYVSHGGNYLAKELTDDG